MISRGRVGRRLCVAAGLVLFAGALAACEAPMEAKWRQKGVSKDRQQKDQSYCDGAAELAAGYGMSGRGASELDQRDAFENCMRDKGYKARPVRSKKPKVPRPRKQ